ncbi:GvpL/GvpF family gas vesicle protein [Alkalihalobacterium elongatum]|uniref:GvpL/GvpF family gas vesicle protein n=1 Tax=Alkalihalobacterium elongatum TaxID=2675466 RepID=UPI001C1F6585|nr:GvpL/GvpF family gas vesicle protein [Alkalihalobacterium elongatum]
MTAEMNKNRLIYVYALVPSNEKGKIELENLMGIDGNSRISHKEFDHITAVLCELDSNEFSIDSIEKNTQDPQWLTVKATHHHEIVNNLHKSCTVVPLKFCTIYSNETSLKQELQQNQEDILKLFTRFENCDGWNVKIYCQKETWLAFWEVHDRTVLKEKEKISQMSPGTQFLMKKKLKQKLIHTVDSHIEKVIHQFHELLIKNSTQYTSKKIWNKQVTGKQEEMVWNGVYLVENNDDTLNEIKKVIKQFQLNYEKQGLMIEITGPWPPYDFLDVEREGLKIG